MESFKRDLGKKPFDASNTECVALGPVQALFLCAVGPKGRLGTSLPLCFASIRCCLCCPYIP